MDKTPKKRGRPPGKRDTVARKRRTADEKQLSPSEPRRRVIQKTVRIDESLLAAIMRKTGEDHVRGVDVDEALRHYLKQPPLSELEIYIQWFLYRKMSKELERKTLGFIGFMSAPWADPNKEALREFIDQILTVNPLDLSRLPQRPKKEP